MNKSILLLICAALFSSCSVTQKMAVSSPVEDVGVHQYPTVADLDIKPQKVTSTEEWRFVPFNWGQPTLDVRKGNMIAEMLEANGGDVLLEPHTVYTKRMFGKRTLKISGFVASFDNFRKASDEDLKALEIGYRKSERPVYNVSKKPMFPQLANKFSSGKKKTASNAFKIAVGFTASDLVGCEYSDGRRFGYGVNFEYQRHMPSSFYYAAGLGFTSRGFITDNSELVSHIFNINPINFGYNLQLNKFSVFAQLGWYMDISMADNLDNYGSRYGQMYCDGIFDTGLKYGIGLKYGKISLELMNYNGFMPRFQENYNNYDEYKQKSLSLSLGITF